MRSAAFQAARQREALGGEYVRITNRWVEELGSRILPRAAQLSPRLVADLTHHAG
jgi:hypothetical protein